MKVYIISKAKILFAPAKAANAGGVGMSGLVEPEFRAEIMEQRGIK